MDLVGVRGAVERQLPAWLRGEIIRRRNRTRRRFNITGVESFTVGAGLEFELYWLEGHTPTGDKTEGPTLDVRALGDVVWRLDLLRDAPHVHLCPVDLRTTPSPHDPRIHFEPGDLRSVVREGFDFLGRSFGAAFALNRRAAVRHLPLDDDEVQAGIAEAERRARALIERYGVCS